MSSTGVEAQKAMTAADENIARAVQGDPTRKAELAIQLADAKARLHDAKMHEVEVLYLVANSDMLPNSRSAALVRITEILGL